MPPEFENTTNEVTCAGVVVGDVVTGGVDVEGGEVVLTVVVGLVKRILEIEIRGDDEGTTFDVGGGTTEVALVNAITKGGAG